MGLIGFISLILGVCIGFYIFGNNKKNTATLDCSANYHYINESLGCKPSQVIRKGLYTELSLELEDYIKSQNENGNSNLVSVYFRDFGGGPTFGINTDEYFAPASLLKVPLLVSILSLAEDNPKLLEEKTSYQTLATHLTQTTEVPELKPNTMYTIKELLERMIIYSDNISFWLLQDYLDRRYPDKFVVSDTMKELGIISPRTGDEKTITVRGYASIFRQLYNASYISSEMSELALDLMTRSIYAYGLVSGVPNSFRVAHKFGELGLPNGEKQLHDCGIIYFPKNPYLLCVMTKGTDSQKLTRIIQEISTMVYKEIDSRKIK